VDILKSILTETAAQQIIGREGKTATFLTSQKRPFLRLFEFLRKIYFIVSQNSINGVSFETLIVR
jgi:hypothetical protein